MDNEESKLVTSQPLDDGKLNEPLIDRKQISSKGDLLVDVNTESMIQAHQKTSKLINGCELIDSKLHSPLSRQNSNIRRLVFNVLVNGNASCIECDEMNDGLFLTEESLPIAYENIVYFEIPNQDTGDVFEFDSEQLNYEPVTLHRSVSHLNGNKTVEKESTGNGDPNENTTDDSMLHANDFHDPADYDADLESYDEVYEGLFIGGLVFVQTINSLGEAEVSTCSLVLEFQSLQDLLDFNDFIQAQLSRQTWRPRTVLLFLNPASGRGKAVETYESTIANKLRLAGIVADVRITDKDGANSVKGIIFSTDYSVYDAIVIVGGDGSYRDAVSAIYEKMHNQGLVNLDTGTESLPALDNIKFAIIPSGSGNGVVHYLTRSFSIDHSIAALILGRTTPLPVVCVRNTTDNTLVGIAIVCVNYGITSDAIVVADRWKFLGPGKYVIGVTSAMLKHKSFRAKIQMQLVHQPSSNSDHSKSKTQTIKGEFKDLMMLVNGISDENEVPRMARQNGDLFITPDCTIYQQTGFLVNLGLYSQKIYSHSTVNFYKSNDVTFELTDDNKERSGTKAFINLDGDIYSLKQDAFKINYFPNLIQAYSLGFSATK